MRRLVILAVLASSAFYLGAAPSAQGGPIVPNIVGGPTNVIASPPPPPPPSGAFSASYGSITPAYLASGTPPTVTSSFTLGSGTALFGGSSVGAFNISNLTVDASPFTGNLPPSASGPVNLSNPFTVTDPSNGKTATFSFTNPAAVTETGMPPGMVTGNLKASVQLTSNNDPNLNLSAFANGGTFLASFSNIDFELEGDPGVAIYPSGPDLPISFTFSITPNVSAPTVPEPGSLALWGLAAAGGLSGLWRRLRNRMA